MKQSPRNMRLPRRQKPAARNDKMLQGGTRYAN